ncbi:helix-turn-helix domain-containing protein [Vibrio mimicus]
MGGLSKFLSLAQGELFQDIICLLERELIIPHQPLPAGEAMFHLVLDGHCWLRLDKEPPQHLGPGSFVLSSQGQAHSISREVVEGHSSYVDLLCGRIKYAKGAGNLLMQGLPAQICVCLSQYPGLPVLQLLTDTLRREYLQSKPGASAIINAIVQIIFAYALRAYANMNNSKPSWLTLLADERLGKSVQAMLRSPEQPWSLYSLGKLSSMSRATYARQFKDKSGSTPGEVLLTIRMMHASRLLINSRRTLVDIAEAVGYQSEAAFSKAFKSLLGVNPGQWRRQQRNLFKGIEKSNYDPKRF